MPSLPPSLTRFTRAERNKEEKRKRKTENRKPHAQSDDEGRDEIRDVAFKRCRKKGNQGKRKKKKEKQKPNGKKQFVCLVRNKKKRQPFCRERKSDHLLLRSHHSPPTTTLEKSISRTTAFFEGFSLRSQIIGSVEDFPQSTPRDVFEVRRAGKEKTGKKNWIT